MDRGEKYAERRFWRYCTSSIHKTRLTGASTRSRTLFGQRAEIDQKAIFAGASLWSSAVEMWFANRLSSLSCWIFTVEYRCDISAPSDPSVAFSADTCNLRHCAPGACAACYFGAHVFSLVTFARVEILSGSRSFTALIMEFKDHFLGDLDKAAPLHSFSLRLRRCIERGDRRQHLANFKCDYI